GNRNVNRPDSGDAGLRRVCGIAQELCARVWLVLLSALTGARVAAQRACVVLLSGSAIDGTCLSGSIRGRFRGPYRLVGQVDRGIVDWPVPVRTGALCGLGVQLVVSTQPTGGRRGSGRRGGAAGHARKD